MERLDPHPRRPSSEQQRQLVRSGLVMGWAGCGRGGRAEGGAQGGRRTVVWGTAHACWNTQYRGAYEEGVGVTR